MDQQTSFSDRMFWPGVAVAVLALGGIGVFVHKVVTRHSTPVAARTEQAPTSSPTAAKEPAVETTTEPAIAEQVAADGELTVSEKPVEVAAAPEANPKAAMEDESPYVVPDRKPYISRETFAPPPKPAPPKKPIAKVPAPAPAVKPPMVAVKSPAVPATQPDDDTKKSAPPPLIPGLKPPVYVMRDGRKIVAIKVVDLGDSFGLKTANGQIITVLKDDVTEVQK